VFAAVGFETTAPATAVAVKEAAAAGIDNFFVLCGHKLVVPAMQALVSGRNNNIDGFICPGHVSVITGYNSYAGIVKDFRRPCVVAGFEPVQILEAVAEICRQLAEGTAELKSVYAAVVSASGNSVARQVMDECFEVTDGWWRGLGRIEESCLKLRDGYASFDAAGRFGITERENGRSAGCRCGEVLCGLIEPPQCGLFAETCSPTSPVGPCMVSSEGACAAHYKYGR
jgi:hydrogenase expression/formation protein HypD